MRILQVITSLRTGGAERLMVDLIPRLQSMGHQVRLLLLDGTVTPYYEQLQQTGVRIYALGHGSGTMYNPLFLFGMWKFLHRHHFNLIHTHNTPCQILVAAVPHRKSTRYVTTEHNTTNRRRAWRLFRPVDRWMYRRYDHIISVSKAVQENLQRALNVPALCQRMSVVPNGIEWKRFSEAAPCAELVERYRGKHLVVMVAAFRPQKDQPTLIRAMAQLPADYHLLLVGDGECRGACEALTRELHLEGRVTFTGIRTDVPEVLAAASVVVLSSCYEGLSLSCLEAMASGRPFVASDVEGIHDLVEGAGVLFPLGSSRLLVQCIRQCGEDSAYAQEVAARCQQRAANYDIRAMVNGYERIYQAITL